MGQKALVSSANMINFSLFKTLSIDH